MTDRWVRMARDGEVGRFDRLELKVRQAQGWVIVPEEGPASPSTGTVTPSSTAPAPEDLPPPDEGEEG